MAKGYSLDVRKKALEYMEKGNWRKKQSGIWNIKMDDGKMKETKRERRLEETRRFVKRFKIV
ncbi:hypothetical protein AGMMS50222_09970 [Endomicrobiia bacterium]|nr:hypothetical protein AGMMS50222_09970 [Endomicrobiia bacterium]